MGINKPKLVLAVIVLEGGLVLSYELASSRLLAPYFGNSLPVWSFILAITLLGLATGYGWGGLRSKKQAIGKELSFFITLSSCYVVGMLSFFPYLGDLISRCSFLVALMLSAVLILWLPMAGLGTVSPLVVEYLHRAENKPAGMHGGKVFFISTLGGVLFLFPMTLWWMPALGTTRPLLFLASLLVFFSFLCFRQRKHLWIFLTILLISLCVEVLKIFFHSRHGFVFRSEHPLGEVWVTQDEKQIVRLWMNGIIQSELGKENQGMPYAQLILRRLEKPDNETRRVLIVGLGGAYLANALTEMGYKTDAVEIHPEIIRAAREYFGLKKEVEVFCEDGRFFINRMKSSSVYDAVILDVFHGESPPYYLFTKECFNKLGLLIKEGGWLCINWHGYIRRKEGKGTHYLISTLRASGFSVEMVPTASDEDYRNLVFFAKHSPLPVPVSADSVSTDSHPKGEWFNALAQLRWRIRYFQYSAASRK